MSVTNFEDLRCWQEARILTNMVFAACRTLPLSRDYASSDQFRRAALSIMNNVAEGFGRLSPKEFVRFLDIAQSSAMEVKNMTYIFEDISYLDRDAALNIRSKAETTKKIIRGLIHYYQSQLSETQKSR
jgi:four helix bundle protein